MIDAISHQSAGDRKVRLPKELFAVAVMGRDPKTNRRKRELLTFLNRAPAMHLYGRVKKNNEDVVLMRADVTEWKELEWTNDAMKQLERIEAKAVERNVRQATRQQTRRAILLAKARLRVKGRAT